MSPQAQKHSVLVAIRILSRATTRRELHASYLISVCSRYSRHLYIRLGLAIRRRRQELDWSQERLAEIADVHRNFGGLVERGEQNVSIDSLVRFSASLKTSLGRLVDDAGL